MNRLSLLLFAVWIATLSGSALAEPATVAACAECHGSDGMGLDNPMVPVIAGMPAGHIEEAIYAYVDGARTCLREARMCETVAALTEDDVSEVAEYYSQKTRAASRDAFDEKLAAEGAELHAANCAACHLPPHDKNVEYAVGIPLHGQRSEYLRYAIEAYFHGDREALLETMASAIRGLAPGDLGALVHYYASYRPPE
jgi:cytochrome c553